MAKKSALSRRASDSGKEDLKKKKKKKGQVGPKAASMKAVAPKPNPFETIWSRRKFDILGKKRKGEERRIGLARARSIDKRKKTLLKEYERSGKASVFVDKRIGENNEEMGEFEKAILRTQREYKVKLNKKNKFNLSDGEDDDYDDQEGVGFLGRDDFEDEGIPDDDEGDDGDARTGKSQRLSIFSKQLEGPDFSNRTGGDLSPGEENKHKGKKEVMEEIILKSKMFKAQKAKDKEENEQLMDELDKNFSSLVQSEALLSLTDPGHMKALKALVNKSLPQDALEKDNMSSSTKGESTLQDVPDAYDKLVKEMSLDMRARPSDRTKTPEEIAQGERERLAELEEERQKRMLATDDNSDEDDDGHEAENSVALKSRSISGDDLGDSFALEEQPRRKGWVDEILEREAAANSSEEGDDFSEESEGAEEDSGAGSSDEHSDEDVKKCSIKDWEQSDEEQFDQDSDDNDEEDDVDESVKHEKKSVSEMRKRDEAVAERKNSQTQTKPALTQAKSLPYLIDAPKSLDELNVLLENRSNSEIILLIDRIRVSNAVAIAAENRKKMQIFYGVLLQYFAVLATICARQRILRTRTQFCELIKSTEVSSWPSLKTIFLLRLWSMIFPCSDFRHVVMTPVTLLMCEYLMRCPLLSGRDIAIGCFLCSMVLTLTKQSKKFCPEALMFLRTLLFAATDRKITNRNSQMFDDHMELRTVGPLLRFNEGSVDIIPLKFLELMDMPEDAGYFSSDSFRASILVSVVETIRGFINVYRDLIAFPEVFSPISNSLLEVSRQEKMPAKLKQIMDDVARLINEKADECYKIRRPLQMRKQKPVPIKLVNPKFEENFVKGRDYDPDRERSERRKLKKLIKQEAKGAVRELRKDNYFLLEVKEREKAELEQEKAEQYGRAKAFLQEQEHAFKSGQLGKGRKRRR
ncbi:hypothetical protein MLD38_005529 [Melastoma candidum]|uniref:Uncharacterized protein n=1 Tax=Melastoma candidum TaxID=119954 RepID=A0ACB9RL74_9MYRT|nr:hypothetical protein MLD38_005529 [Melastoma candidum]